jgi:lipopolysaccharide transport system permease protein
MLRMARDLVQYRHLLSMLAWRDIRIRYKQSVMGFLWALLMPVMIVSAGVLIKQAVSTLSGAGATLDDVASVALRALPWSFVVASLRFATISLTSNSNLVTKIYFPREVFPLSAVIASFLDLIVASPVVAVVIIFAGATASPHMLWLPVLLLLLVLITAGGAMVLACANVFFRDVKYLVEVLLTFGIFFTPVFYSVDKVGSWGPILLLNPIAPILEAMDDVVIRGQAPNLAWLGYATCWAAFGFVGAWKIFDEAETAFAESI